MSENQVTYKDLTPINESLATVNTRMNGVEKILDKLMTNDLVHLNDKIDKLNTAFTELNKSILPFIQKTNDAIRNFDEKDKTLSKNVDEIKNVIDSLKKWQYKIIAGLGIIIFMITFFSDEIKNLFK